jgi:ribosomal protein S18 acetylase RimI-like enzyme
MPIVPMTRDHAPQVANLHRQSIRTGLTAWLGQRFCEKLYWGLANTPYSFVLVYEDEQKHPLGFVCATTNTSRMYRHVLTRRFISLAFTALGKLLRPSTISRVWKSISRPKTFTSGDFSDLHLPEEEIVSIGVTPEAQGKKIGTQLIEAAFQRFRDQGRFRVRVWTTEDNEQATAFYQRRGFKLVATGQHHSGGIRIFIADLRENKLVS